MSRQKKPGLFFMVKRVSIQGIAGSFHHAAAKKYFGNEVEIISCRNFRAVVKIASDKQQSDGGIMAIENSIAGSILPNYNLIQQSNLFIAGEIYLQIDQNLLVVPGVSLKDVREVHSHPMALLQCEDYLDKYPEWKLVETEDTAMSARSLQEAGSQNTAAIAGKMAAKIYQLDILEADIQSNKDNYTRFLFVCPRQDKIIEDANKASINFHTDHSVGSLAKVLAVIAEANVNLSKLQSVPIPQTQWQYSFHADLEFDDLQQFEKMIAKVKAKTESLTILGLYRSGPTIQR